MSKWFCTTNLKSDKVMNPAEAGYFAGFLDGEGTIGVYRGRRKENRSGIRFQTVLRLCNTDFAALEAIQRMCGNGRIAQVTAPKNPNYRTGYILTFSSSQITHLLPQLIPYLVIKKRQAELALEFQLSIVSGRNISADREIAANEAYASTRRMNAKGPRGLVAVN